ncbi:hypothetical protein J6590_029813 [Homalodisca vitripennis]|nr:hypothetical protein J6590_029813 [Homalodisca vitripennis]
MSREASTTKCSHRPSRPISTRVILELQDNQNHKLPKMQRNVDKINKIEKGEVVWVISKTAKSSRTTDPNHYKSFAASYN